MQEFVLVEVIVIVVAIFSFMSILTTIPRADVVVASEHPRLEKFAWIVGWTIRWAFAAALAYAAYWLAANPGVSLARATFADYVTWDTWFIPAGGAVASFLLSFAVYQGARWCSGRRLPRIRMAIVGSLFATIAVIHASLSILGYLLGFLCSLAGKWGEPAAEWLFDAAASFAERFADAVDVWRQAAQDPGGPFEETFCFFVPKLDAL